jgi:hypothetical protein
MPLICGLRALRLARVRVLLLVASMVAGCGVFERPLDVQLDVWNRTLDPIFLVDQLGTRLDVPACGHASAESFRVNDYKVSTESGLWFGGGEGNVSGLPSHRFIISASAHDPLVSVPGTGPLPELPACEGHPTDLIPPSN